MPTTSNRQASIDSRRIALEREIAIRVPRFDTFVTEYSSNISTTGMFIVSESPQAPGTTFTFEFSVADDWKLIRGKAQVVWTRYRDEAEERPAGMGVRFIELDPQSRRLIRWIVEKHIREGGKPFELDELRNVIDEALEEVIDTEDAVSAARPSSRSKSARKPRSQPQASRPPSARGQGSDRRLFPLLATAAVIVLALVFLFWLTEWIPGASDESESGSESASIAGDTPGDTSPDAGGEGGLSDSEDSSQVQPALAPGDQGASGPGASPPVGSAFESVRNSLTQWSAAWSDQDVEGYLAAYSRDFKPNGTSRAAWEATRRERLRTPEFIKVSITQLEITRLQDNLVQASFFQSYRSDRFSDAVRKEVQMVWEDGTWKIWREVAR